MILGGRSTIEPVDASYADLCAAVWNMPGLSDEFACHAGEVAGELTICFRGTHSWQEWLADFAALPLPAEAVNLFSSQLFPIEAATDARIGPVHAGFLAGAARLMPAVTAAVAPGRRFALTGHSLGGALATVVAGFLAVNGTPPFEVVTFGAPRAGQAALAHVLHSIPLRQYRYRADPVPYVPTDPPFCHAREPLLQLGSPNGFVLTDHGISHYQQELRHVAEIRA